MEIPQGSRKEKLPAVALWCAETPPLLPGALGRVLVESTNVALWRHVRGHVVNKLRGDDPLLVAAVPILDSAATAGIPREQLYKAQICEAANAHAFFRACVARVVGIVPHDTNPRALVMLLQGISRCSADVDPPDWTLDNLPTARIARLDDEGDADAAAVAALKASLAELHAVTAKAAPKMLPRNGATRRLLLILARAQDDVLGSLDAIAAAVDSTVAEKLSILALGYTERLALVQRLVERQLEQARVSLSIRERVQAGVSKQQREFLLRQQLAAIQKELGANSEAGDEVGVLEKKIAALDLPEYAAAAVQTDLGRVRRLNPANADYHVLLTFLEFVASLPWNNQTRDCLDAVKVQKQLDNDHEGLERVKRRIVAHVAVMQRQAKTGSDNVRAPLLCLVGPPGVGKTSLGQSIAAALGRKFARVALGGVRDESEIRGHRRTYVGALPGTLLQALSRCGSRNPVILLDELDKMGADARGDPAAALLEALDPAQNHAFRDRYLNLPFDLSRVFFVCTANSLDAVPPALRDRLEIVELPGYMLEQKLGIAERHLLPRQRRAHALEADQLIVSSAALEAVVERYTSEAGVRELDRAIAALCRDAVTRLSTEPSQAATYVTEADLEPVLGPPRHTAVEGLGVPMPGTALGLAWTPVGGTILLVEASLTPADAAEARLVCTGRLGPVITESVQIAHSWIRANAAKIAPVPAAVNLHVHFPAGATPKDGPSAGVAVLVALVSLLLDVPAADGLAMTGELTLSGRVLPVGGIREKLHAAHRAHGRVQRVLLPRANERDFSEVSAAVQRSLVVTFVDTAWDVLSVAFPSFAPRWASGGAQARL